MTWFKGLLRRPERTSDGDPVRTEVSSAINRYRDSLDQVRVTAVRSTVASQAANQTLADLVEFMERTQ